MALVRQSGRICGSSDKRHGDISHLNFYFSLFPPISFRHCFSPHLASPLLSSALLLQRPLHCTLQNSPMLLSILVTLALALAKIALTQHELRSRPFAKLNAHRALHNTPISSISNGTNTPTQSTAGTNTPRLSITAASSCSYWLEDIKHQGFSPFNTNPSSYQVFRNVKDFGAIGTTLYFLRYGASVHLYICR